MKKKKLKYLDDEEKKLIKAYEEGRTKPVENAEEMRLIAIKAAKNYLDKNKNINIRISERDVYKIKTKAAEKGLPYQTPIAAILHQYANDKIKASL